MNTSSNPCHSAEFYGNKKCTWVATHTDAMVAIIIVSTLTACLLALALACFCGWGQRRAREKRSNARFTDTASWERTLGGMSFTGGKDSGGFGV